MKLKITRDSEEVDIKIIHDTKELDFDYVTFINLLYERSKLEGTEFSSDISPEEREQIKKMITELNKLVDSQREDL